jgi:hypothetical protein
LKQHAHEAPVVVGGRGKAAAADRRRYSESRLRFLQFNGAVHVLARALLLRDEARLLCLRHVVGRVVHLERGKNVLAEIILEFLAGYHLNKPAGYVSAGAVVPALARIEQERSAERISFTGARLEIAQGRAGERIAQSGRVRQEVSDRRRS